MVALHRRRRGAARERFQAAPRLRAAADGGGDGSGRWRRADLPHADYGAGSGEEALACDALRVMPIKYAD